MKIGLIDVDGHNFPSLPLMKLSAWHKRQGDSVEWYNPWDGLVEPYDKVYMSKVFSFTPDYGNPVYAKEVSRGGSGYCISTANGRETYDTKIDTALPYEVEHIYPDYGLYGIADTAYGFLTRGCPRGCGFCHVATKEGKHSYKVADLHEFWRGQPNIVLCDPNILACADHMELLQQLIYSKATVEINQGLDIRLVTDENLEMIRQIKMRSIHLAYDRYQDKAIVEPRLQAFKEKTGYDKNKGGVLVYILVNYDTTLEQDIERIQFCRSLNFAPYPMIYDKEHCDPVYKSLQRWCNNYIFWKVPTFEEYNTKEHRNEQ
jgi:hypothetical protein